MDQESLEKLVLERLAPTRTMEQINNWIPRLIETTRERLEKKRKVDNAKMITTQYACSFCKNRDQGLFKEDNQHGQVVCTSCGSVVMDRKVHDGEWKRQFSGDDNPSQHGPVPDPHLSSSHNLRTNITLGSGKGAGAKVTKKELADLKNVQDKVELNLSNMKFDVEHRTTRIGYKDKQKKEVFTILEEVGNSLQIHEKVIGIAKGYFADYREAQEQVIQRDAVEAASLILALRSSSEALQKSPSGTQGIKRVRDPNSAPVPRTVRPKVTLKELHPFVCKKCGRPCGTKKDLRFHSRSCPKKGEPDLSPSELETALEAYQ
mmetsp:Transcript_13135/g.24348  ORF Transcript_13135/g.24348 Transcript_13135/m.24348 type:complete len:319 (+) Transcript_13135:203-1159(+)